MTTKKKTISIRLKRSKIGCLPRHRATVNGLGLRRIGDERTLENTPAVRGMIKSVIHLLEITAETR
jgi:large subunit ribosomal protein L30